MGLFDIFKSDKAATSKTGVFSVKGKDVIPMDKLPTGGSLNAIAKSLGFIDFDGINTFDSKIFEYAAFKNKTKEPIFVCTKDKQQSISYSDVEGLIKEIDWDFEWSLLD